jgi:hypothetical protein
LAFAAFAASAALAFLFSTFLLHAILHPAALALQLAATLCLAPLATRAAAVTSPPPGMRILFDNLPGYPDNLMRGANGRYWVGLVKPRSAFNDATAAKPWLRAVALRLPRAWWPVPPAYGHVFAFTAEGGAEPRVVANLQDPSGAYPSTTGITEVGDRLYVQSLHAAHLGYLSTPAGL